MKNYKSLSARPSSIMWYIPFIQCGKQNFQIINVYVWMKKRNYYRLLWEEEEKNEIEAIRDARDIYSGGGDGGHLFSIVNSHRNEKKEKKCFSLFRNGCVYFQGIFFG